MKKLVFLASLLVTLISILPGCTKDNDNRSATESIGFSQDDKIQDKHLLISAAPQTLTDHFSMKLMNGAVANTSIRINLTNNTTEAVAAYNLANGLTGNNQVLVLPASLYTIASSISITAGDSIAKLPIQISNTSGLDLSRKYAVGVSISSIDGGHIVATNRNSMMVIFDLINYLDGVYKVTGYTLAAGDAQKTGYLPSNEIDFLTAGANQVVWDPDYPIYYADLSQMPSGYFPFITVDNTTQIVLHIQSIVGLYKTFPIVRTDIIGTEQRYDPVTKTLHFEFSWGGGPLQRLFSINAQWVRPR